MKENETNHNPKAPFTRRALWIAGIGLIAAFVGAGTIVLTQPGIMNGVLTGASAVGNTKVARLCLLVGTDPDAGSDGRTSPKRPTPLQCAAFAGNLDIVELLLSYGADANAKDANDWTALHWTALGGPQNVEGAETPMAPASYVPPDRYRRIAEALIKHGADANAKDDEGGTPLHRAAAVGLKDMAELLTAKGADVKARKADGCTPLHAAARAGHADVAALLIAKGADVNAKSQSGGTPLHWAAESGKKQVVEALLAKGADAQAKDASGKTPADLAYSEPIKALIRKASAK